MCYYVGSNSHGQIGNGMPANIESIYEAFTAHKSLTAITNLPHNACITNIATGRDNVYYLLSNGECFVCGNNDRQQLLTSNETMRKLCCCWSRRPLVPWDVCHLIIVFTPRPHRIHCKTLLSPICIHSHTASISNGVVSDHRFLINALNHELYGVGSNHSKQFNIDCSSDCNDVELDINTLNFVQIGYFQRNKLRLRDIHCSMGYSVFLTDSGALYVCGTSTGGGLGLGALTNSNGIRLVEGLAAQSVVVDVSCGCDHTLALTQDGKLYAWGWNQNAQLGLGHSDSVNVPQLITRLVHVHIVKIASGYQHNLVLDANGNVYSFGDNYYNQCGVFLDPILYPVPISVFNADEEIVVTDMKCGAYHNVVCANGVDYYLWGDNAYNQCLVDEGPGGVVQEPTKFVHADKYIGSEYRIIAMYPGQSETRVVTQRREQYDIAEYDATTGSK